MQPHSVEANGKAIHPLFILLPCEARQSLASVFIIMAPSDSFFFLEQAVLSEATACAGSAPAFLLCCQASLPVLPLQMHLFICPSWAPLATACSCFSLCLSTAPPRFLYCRAQHHLAGNLPEDCEVHEARGCILFSSVSVWPSSGPKPGKSSMRVLSDQWTRKPSSDGPERRAPWGAEGVLIYWVLTCWVIKNARELERGWEGGGGSLWGVSFFQPAVSRVGNEASNAQSLLSIPSSYTPGPTHNWLNASKDLQFIFRC